MKTRIMTRVLARLIVWGFMWTSILASAAPARPGQAQMFIDGNTAFALDLYAQLKSSPGNLFFSPYSISTALGMTYLGARGDTEKQMARVLHLSAPQSAVPKAFGQLQNELSEAAKQQGTQLNIANALWAQQGHPFLPDFVQAAKLAYQANINSADFVHEAEPARNEINRWIAEETKEKIQDILPAGSLTALTRLVLANAIYFKGAWAQQFNKSQTATQPFHLTPVSQAEVSLMHQTESVNYMQEGDFQAVEVPYVGNQLSMLILLPSRVDGLTSLENRLSPALLSKSLSKMRQQKVDLFLPRFKLESGFELSQTLSKMGMPDAFDSKADFSGMDDAQDLFVSAVFHKAWAEVNEEGTEAAAATAVLLQKMAVVKEPPIPLFRADHPFLFLIRETRSGSILFLGRLSDPKA